MKPIKGIKISRLGISLALACLLAAVFLFLRHRQWNFPLLEGGLLLVILAAVFPSLFLPLEKILSPLLKALNFIYQALLLGTFFFLVITPLALFFKLTGRDQLKLKFPGQAENYREKTLPRTIDHMLKPY